MEHLKSTNEQRYCLVFDREGNTINIVHTPESIERHLHKDDLYMMINRKKLNRITKLFERHLRKFKEETTVVKADECQEYIYEFDDIELSEEAIWWIDKFVLEFLRRLIVKANMDGKKVIDEDIACKLTKRFFSDWTVFGNKKILDKIKDELKDEF